MKRAEKEEQAYRATQKALAIFARDERLTLVREGDGTIEFKKVGPTIIRKDIFADGREVLERDVPLTAVELAVFRALLDGWKVLIVRR
jgi:hypothetical protein